MHNEQLNPWKTAFNRAVAEISSSRKQEYKKPEIIEILTKAKSDAMGEAFKEVSERFHDRHGVAISDDLVNDQQQ